MEYSLRDRVEGCWLGKAVGGTLGQTFEGLSGPLSVDYYHPVPTEMVPNDDLNLQVLYAVAMMELPEPRVDRHVIAKAWAEHVSFPWLEYAVGQRNLAEGLEPPHTGAFDNWFTWGEGAAIRTELWACLAPGDPDLAAAYAYEDACFDHAGTGIEVAQFLARLQSLAFVQSDPGALIDAALEPLPPASEIRSVVTDVRGWVEEVDDWREIHARIMNKYGRRHFTDSVINTGFVILGWLKGRSFSERITITNNCAEDADSSTATLGALLGILDPGSIEERWSRPIGRRVILNPEIQGVDAPEDIDAFIGLIERLREELPRSAPTVHSADFDPEQRAIEVGVAHFNTAWGSFEQRDHTELPPAGSTPPMLDYEPLRLPGTWVKLPRTEFRDRLLMLRYTLDGHDARDVRLMFNCSEDYRVWLDGRYLHGAQGSRLEPDPNMPPLGQFVDFQLSEGVHTLEIAIKRPPVDRSAAEWVIALVERPGHMWVPNAFRHCAAKQGRVAVAERTAAH